ncbi:YggS family pyridoxal phosphate-dependent enzyme [Paraferrimonas sp. SM1919]|uniref:YggS family pyridoxal phosphate-dependent enzyme n=1 Tax=Paraferrimonas sp. SM1919 TaxID=2662263 RepID=UPI0013D315FF|nr:YggS family pyridoxal phosphate-dependent enzyme [Paraferrimonas sp. SM1919]
MTNIADRYNTIIKQIDAASKHSSQQQVSLLAVSKTKPLADILALYSLGQRHFGENYVQEGVEKIQTCPHKDISWHFIGPLQSNKSKLVAEHFDWMHTVDRLKIAKRLNDQRPADKAPLNVCIQVNISNEASKSGIPLEQVDELAKQLSELENIKLRGLMAIPANSKDEAQQNLEFSQLKQAFDKLAEQYPDIDTLSMGMSGDLDLAINNGSTMVRVGSAIFGARTVKQ